MRRSLRTIILFTTMILIAGSIIASVLIDRTQPIKLAHNSTNSALLDKIQPDNSPDELRQAAPMNDVGENCETCAGKETTTTPPLGFGKTTIVDTTLEKAQAEVGFKIRKPSYLPFLSKQRVQLVKDHLNDGKVMASVILIYDVPSADIKLPDDAVHKGGFAVYQIPGDGPKETLFPTTDIEIDGVTGRIQAPQGVGITPIQVFWAKNGVYYNVVGEGLSKEELVKIARSLK